MGAGDSNNDGDNDNNHAGDDGYKHADYDDGDYCQHLHDHHQQ